MSSWFVDPPDAAFRTLSWRTGTKGPLRAAFAARRVRIADGPEAAGAQHLPGAERWLVCEHRSTGERKFHLASHPADASLEQLAAAIKARWSCEQRHQQLKEELGLDHYEGRSWRGLHHHALLCQMAMAFLQSLRIGGKKGAAAATKPGWQDRRHSRACPNCAVASSLPCSATSNAARAATTACPGTCCYELGRVVLERVSKLLVLPGKLIHEEAWLLALVHGLGLRFKIVAVR